MLFNKQLDKALRVCPTCGHHFRLSAAARLDQLLDPGTWAERDAGLQSVDRARVRRPEGLSGPARRGPDRDRDARRGGLGDRRARRHAGRICVMDFGFMGGSMGAVVGEKVTRAAEYALEARVPLIIVSASGGARMQEGTLALMQLAKTLPRSSACAPPACRSSRVLSDPTTGGVFASFAAVGDVNVAEPNALIGFAGSRVSAGTIAQELPAGFQRSEFLFSHGFIDRVVARAGAARRARRACCALLPARDREPARAGRSTTTCRASGRCPSCVARRAGRRARAATPSTTASPRATGATDAPERAAARRDPRDDGLGAGPARAQPAPAADARVRRRHDRRLHRAPRRPPVRRRRGDGRGLARLDGRRIVVIGQQKGADTDENIRRNFGMPHPEGYRKAMRIMELAERFGLPIVTFVDVPGRASRAPNPRSAASPRRSPARSA